MSMEPVAIVGVGMMTAVGLSAAETAAAVRSATSRFSESTLLDRALVPVTMAEVPEAALPDLADGVDGLPALSARERRMLRLATRPFRECVNALGGKVPTVGLCLALPEIETARPLDRALFLTRFARQVGGTIIPAASDASHIGRAGGLVAIGQAVLTIQAGHAEFIVAGGIDSYFDLYVLTALDAEQRIKSHTSLDGFIPGEGAGFVLLASARAAAARRLPILGYVSPMAGGFEAGHLYSEAPYRGEGLASTFQQLVAQGVVDAPIGDVYSTMTGESHWSKEWGVAHIRSRAAFRPNATMHHPADCFGDIGAASGPIMVGLAALGIKNSYRRSPTLVYGSSDHGARAAVVVTA